MSHPNTYPIYTRCEPERICVSDINQVEVSPIYGYNRYGKRIYPCWWWEYITVGDQRRKRLWDGNGKVLWDTGWFALNRRDRRRVLHGIRKIDAGVRLVRQIETWFRGLRLQNAA